MIIVNEHSRTYYPFSRKRGNPQSLGAGKKLSFAPYSTSANYSTISRWCFQSYYSSTTWGVPPDCSAMEGTFFSPSLARIGKRRASPRTHSRHFRQESPCSHRYHPSHDTSQCDTLEHAQHGPSARCQQGYCATDMERAQSQTASYQNIQAQPRQTFCREAVRCRWTISQSSGQIPDLVCRREEPDPGFKPHPDGPAVKEGPLGNNDTRLQKKWHGHSLCGLKHARRQGDRRLHAAAPASGIYPFPNLSVMIKKRSP